MNVIQYGEATTFDHEPSETERKAAAHGLALKLLPSLESNGVIYKKVVVDGEPDRWTLCVKFLIQR